MPTTTNYGWTTPADTDLVKDGASAIRTLGTAIDTTVFNNAGAAIAKTIVDAKGDLIAASAADTVVRVAVGTNGQYLKADSTATGGVSWDTLPASGGMTLLQTLTLSGASVTSSSIAGTYKNLQIIVREFKPASDGEALIMRVNGDSNARYCLAASSSSFGLQVAFNQTGWEVTSSQDSGTQTSIIKLDLYDYANTSTIKMGSTLAGTNHHTTPADVRSANATLYYNQTGAITTITLLPTGGGNFSTGSALIYGVS